MMNSKDVEVEVTTTVVLPAATVEANPQGVVAVMTGAVPAIAEAITAVGVDAGLASSAVSVDVDGVIRGGVGGGA